MTEPFCDWWISRRRPCERDATHRLGRMRFCWQHYDRLADTIEHALTRPSGADLLARLRPVVVQFDRERREAADAKNSKGKVYFVERDGYIKIGYTTNILGRLAELGRGGNSIPGMTVGPVRLLATMAGDKAKERDLHMRFAVLRVGGEWFLPNAALWRFIGTLKGCVEPDLCREKSRPINARETFSSN